MQWCYARTPEQSALRGTMGALVWEAQWRRARTCMDEEEESSWTHVSSFAIVHPLVFTQPHLHANTAYEFRVKIMGEGFEWSDISDPIVTPSSPPNPPSNLRCRGPIEDIGGEFGVGLWIRFTFEMPRRTCSEDQLSLQLLGGSGVEGEVTWFDGSSSIRDDGVVVLRLSTPTPPADGDGAVGSQPLLQLPPSTTPGSRVVIVVGGAPSLTTEGWLVARLHSSTMGFGPTAQAFDVLPVGGDDALAARAAARADAGDVAGAVAALHGGAFDVSSGVLDLGDVEYDTPRVVLGQGSFGAVYRGWWRGVDVAVKELIPYGGRDQQAQVRGENSRGFGVGVAGTSLV